MMYSEQYTLLYLGRPHTSWFDSDDIQFDSLPPGLKKIQYNPKKHNFKNFDILSAGLPPLF